MMQNSQFRDTEMWGEGKVRCAQGTLGRTTIKPGKPSRLSEVGIMKWNI
jgi:hypothetical protein